MNVYDIGDLVRLSVQFNDADSAAVDPTVITVRYADPTGLVTQMTYETDVAVYRADVGAYYVDFIVNRAGTWAYRWQSSGLVTAATEGQFQVRRSAFV